MSATAIEYIVEGKRIRSKFIQYNKTGELFCYRCKEFKNQTEFGINNYNKLRNGKDKNCNICRKKLEDARKTRNRGRKDLNRLLLERWHGTKLRNKGIEVDYDWQYLRNLWENQEGRCAISNIDMTYIMDNGRIPTNVSVDRINSKDIYRKENLQLVCMAVNQMKSDLSVERLVYFCKNIISNYEHSYKKEE